MDMHIIQADLSFARASLAVKHKSSLDLPMGQLGKYEGRNKVRTDFFVSIKDWTDEVR